MKKSIWLLVVVVALGFAGSPQLKNRVSFSFGGNYDNVITLTKNNDGGFLVGGIRDALDGSQAGITLIDQSGKQNWITLNGSPFTNSIFADEHKNIYWGTTSGFLKKSNDSGVVLWNKKIADGFVYVFCYRDMVVASTGGDFPKLTFFDSEGNQIQEIYISAEAVQGDWLPKLYGNKLWLFGTPRSKPGSAVVMMDINTGEKIWEKNFPLNLRTTGTVDTNGEGYLVATRLIVSGSPINEFVVTKIDSLGKELWQKNWFGRETDITNTENWIDGTNVSLERNLLVVAGSIQKGNSHTGEKNAYLTGVNATNGKLEWNLVINYRNGYLESTRAVEFTDSGRLAVLGVSVSNLSFNPPNLLYLDFYQVDKVLGVETPQSKIPTGFQLYQNHPNPFNPSTTIRYSLPKQSHVRLAVYDLLGREVAILVNEEKHAGEHEIRFDAFTLPSGIYIYYLKARKFMGMKKTVILK